jgi:4-amino-4-deoxy-L-arabinose transferase-like glycosyltransferase
MSSVGPHILPIVFYLLILLALFVLWIVALVDVVRRHFPDPNTKLIWVLVVVLAHGIGALVYFAIGKKQGSLPGEHWPGA